LTKYIYYGIICKHLKGYLLRPLSRNFIINTLYEDFDGKVSDAEIEQALIRLNIITAVSKEWLKEHYINQKLSAKDCGIISGCSIGTIQKYITKYGLTKRKHGLTKGNNTTRRNKEWRLKTAKAQPHSKGVVVYHVGEDSPFKVYVSISKAAKCLNLAREHVRDCLNPKKLRKTARNYRFEYLTAPLRLPAGKAITINDIKMQIENEDLREKEQAQMIY